MSESPFEQSSSQSSFSSFSDCYDQMSVLSQYKNHQLIGGSSNSSIYSISNTSSDSMILKAIKHCENNKNSSCHDIVHDHECKHLENEFKQLKKISHPNIIQLTNNEFMKNALLSKDNQFGCCIFLEKGNCDLLQMLSSVYPKTLELSYIKYCFQKIASSILYLHEEIRIAHNDIKLENIILFGLEPKISDFGFASKHEKDPIIQVKNWLHRSKKSAAPEIIENIVILKQKNQLHELKAFDERKSDVFAFGVALFNALIHSNPFTKIADSSDPLFSHFYNIDGNYDAFWEDQHISNMIEFIQSFDNSRVCELKNLFEGIFNPNPKQRFSIKQVLNHPWFSN